VRSEPLKEISIRFRSGRMGKMLQVGLKYFYQERIIKRATMIF